MAKSKTPDRKRVDRLAREYRKAQEALDEYVDEYDDIFEEYSIKATERNVRLDKLKRAVRETGIAAGPLEVSIQRKRIFDGRFLYEHFSDRRDVQQALVEVQFKVNTTNFDHLVQAGEIQADEAQKAVKEVKTTHRVLHSPPDVVVG